MYAPLTLKKIEAYSIQIFVQKVFAFLNFEHGNRKNLISPRLSRWGASINHVDN